MFTPSAISRVNHRASYTNDDEGKDKKRNNVLHNNILLAQLGTGHKSSAPMKTRWDRARRYKLPVGVQRPNHLWTGTARSREFDYRDRGLPGGKENSAHFRLRNQKYYLESVGYGGDSVSQLALMQKLFFTPTGGDPRSELPATCQENPDRCRLRPAEARRKTSSRAGVSSLIVRERRSGTRF